MPPPPIWRASLEWRDPPHQPVRHGALRLGPDHVSFDPPTPYQASALIEACADFCEPMAWVLRCPDCPHQDMARVRREVVLAVYQTLYAEGLDLIAWHRLARGVKPKSLAEELERHGIDPRRIRP